MEMKFNLHTPPLGELVKVIRNACVKNFKEVNVDVERIPNLKEDPWSLSSEGISGSPVLLDVGDIENLQNPSLHHTNYEATSLAEIGEIPNGVLLGAGAVCLDEMKKNGELIPNMNLETRQNSSVAMLLDENNKEPVFHEYNHYKTGGLANLLLSKGERGDVIKVHVKVRTGEKDFIETIRCGLTEYYGEQGHVVGMGGVFRIISGKIKSHIMPGFCDHRMDVDFMVKEWLRYFEVEAPLICQSTILSGDFGTDCRLEHTHFFCKENKTGGHYHHDTTPDTIEYLGYFVACNSIYHIRRKVEQ